MLYVFSTNRVKLVARTLITIIKKGRREYVETIGKVEPMYVSVKRIFTDD